MDRPISYTQIREYLNCGYRYDLNYNKSIAPRVADRAPTLGSAGHVGMAAGILGNSIDKALEDWKNDFINNHSMMKLETDPDMLQDIREALEVTTDDVINTASLIVPRALDFLPLSDWETIEYNGVPLVEQKFLIPIHNNNTFVMIIDWVAKHKPTGMVWLIDHKFRKQLQSDEVEEFNMQMPLYQFMLLTLGIETVGSISNQVLAKLPSQPSVNKDGSMSRAKIATTWEVYEEALLKNGLNPNDYLEMKDKFTTDFFRPIYTFRNTTQLRSTWDNIASKVITSISDNPSYIRNLGQLGCRNCWAGEYCMEDLRGGDLNYLMQTQYMPKVVKMEEEGVKQNIIEEEDE